MGNKQLSHVIFLGMFSMIIGCGRPGDVKAKANCFTGLASSVATSCGCSPLTQSVEARLRMTSVPEIAIAKAVSCANGNLNLTVYTWDIAKGALQACLEQEQRIDPKIGDALTAIVTMQDPNLGDNSAAWNQCYSTNLNGAHGSNGSGTSIPGELK